MPLIVIVLSTRWAQSIPNSPVGSPSSAILPPWVMAASMSLSAVGLPDISNPTSKPSTIPSRSMAAARGVGLASTARATRGPGRGLSGGGAADRGGGGEPVRRDIGYDHVPGPGVPGHDRRHEPDRASARDEDILAEDGEGQRAMHGGVLALA